jgi:hypothetical protein
VSPAQVRTFKHAIIAYVCCVSRKLLCTVGQGGNLKNLEPPEQRAPRVTLRQQAKLVTSDGGQIDVIVTDISAEGFRVEAEETFYDGENIVTGETVVLRVERRDDLRAKTCGREDAKQAAPFRNRLTHFSDGPFDGAWGRSPRVGDLVRAAP